MRIDDFTIEKYKSGELFEAVPHFKLLKNVIENDSVHNNDSVYNHTLSVAENVLYIAGINKLFADYFSRLVKNRTVLQLVTAAALFHDIGKVSTFTVSEGITSCDGHEEVSYNLVSGYFQNVEGDSGEKEVIKEIVRQHAVFYPYIETENKNIEDDFNRLENELELYAELLLFCISDIRGSQLEEKNPEVFEFKNSFIMSKLEEYIKKN